MNLEIVDFKQLTEKGFVIYGAQVVAHGAYRALRGLYHVIPECFVVSSMDNNPEEIDGMYNGKKLNIRHVEKAIYV